MALTIEVTKTAALTALGTVGGILQYGNLVGAKFPETKQEWCSFAFAFVIAASGYLAKGCDDVKPQ